MKTNQSNQKRGKFNETIRSRSRTKPIEAFQLRIFGNERDTARNLKQILTEIGKCIDNFYSSRNRFVFFFFLNLTVDLLHPSNRFVSPFYRKQSEEFFAKKMAALQVWK